jgi:hypothetical protein
MKRMLSIVTITVVVMLISSCQTTTDKTTDASTASANKGSMCYSVSGKEINVFNTPWGDKTAKLESSTDEASGGRKQTSLKIEGGTMQGVDYSYNADGSLKKANISIYVGEKREPKINIIYDYSKAAVESVIVDGKETPNCR